MKEGVTNIHPNEVNNYTINDNELTLYAATQHIDNRGKTLNSSILTIRLTSPAEDIINVRLTHFRGAKKRDNFNISTSQPCNIIIDDNDNFIHFTSRKLTAAVSKGEK